MVELNKVYVKKENNKVMVKPYSEVNGIIEYQEVGFFNPRQIPKELFLERFELKKD